MLYYQNLHACQCRRNPGRVGRRQSSKRWVLDDGWASAAILAHILQVIGWCHGRMGGWRFVKSLGSMHYYGLWENQVFQHSHDNDIDCYRVGCGLEDGLWLRRGVGSEATSTTPQLYPAWLLNTRAILPSTETS